MDQGSPAKAARARRQQAARGGPHQPAGQQPRVQEQPTPQKRRQTVPTPLAKLIRAEERLRQREVKTERNKREAKARRSEEQKAEYERRVDADSRRQEEHIARIRRDRGLPDPPSEVQRRLFKEAAAAQASQVRALSIAPCRLRMELP